MVNVLLNVLGVERAVSDTAIIEFLSFVERQPRRSVRRLLDDAGKPDVPGLYVTRSCEYFWATVPYLARDPKRVEDVDSRGPDHAADAVRYGCLWHRPVFKVMKLTGL